MELQSYFLKEFLKIIEKLIILTQFFRYFNAAGSSPTENIGEDHNPETHLPLAIRAANDPNFTLTIFEMITPPLMVLVLEIIFM